MSASSQHSMCPICEREHDDRLHVERMILLAEQEGRWHIGGADIAAIQSLVEQLEASRQVLRDIEAFAEDEYREGDFAYQFALLARAALYPASEPEAS